MLHVSAFILQYIVVNPLLLGKQSKSQLPNIVRNARREHRVVANVLAQMSAKDLANIMSPDLLAAFPVKSRQVVCAQLVGALYDTSPEVAAVVRQLLC